MKISDGLQCSRHPTGRRKTTDFGGCAHLGQKTFCRGELVCHHKGRCRNLLHHADWGYHRTLKAVGNTGNRFVAAINGTAGGVGTLSGLSRIALQKNPFSGFEVTLGLLPGGGGTARLPYLGLERRCLFSEARNSSPTQGRRWGSLTCW